MANDTERSNTPERPLEPVLVFAVTLAIYASLPTTNYYWDGLIYAEFLERVEGFGPELFHPNHLLYNFAGYAAFHLLRGLGLVVRALFALQYLSIFFAAVSVTIFYLICRRVFGAVYLALTVAGIFAFAAGWWRYATDADVYVISMAFLLACFYLLIGPRPMPILAALALFGAMLFHELAALFVPAGGLAIWFQTAYLDGRKQLPLVAKFGFVSTISIVLAYAAAFYLLNREFDTGRFWRWATSSAGAGELGSSGSEGITWLLKGTRQLFIDGSVNLLENTLISKVFFFVFCVACIGLLVSLFALRRSIVLGDLWKQLDPRRTSLIAVCMAWMAPYAVFLMFFEPRNSFYRLFYLPPLVLMIGLFLAFFKRSERPHFAPALLVVVFALYNFIFYIYPNSHPANGSVLALALDAEKVWNDKTLVFYASRRPTDGVIRAVIYFNPQVDWRPVDSLKGAELQETSSNSVDGRSIWIERSGLKMIESDPECYAVFKERFAVDDSSAMSAPKYDLEFSQLKLRIAD